MNKILVAAATSIAMLSGCTTFDPYTGEEKTSSTAIGAGVGAGVGAVVSYIKNKDASSSDRRKRMLTAAGIGAVAGGSVGYYMDSQEAKLRQQLGDSGVSVVREGDNINLVMPGNITFNTGNSAINSNFYQVLDSVALVLAEFDKTIVAVSGHTDSVGSTSSNQALSQQRANSVASYLRSHKVVDARIETIGYGESHPIADNGTAAGRSLNRRVELTLVPITE